METVTTRVRHPVFFDWLDKVDSKGNTLIGAKTALLKSRRPLAIRITKKIIANGEKILGHGLTTMAFALDDSSVAIITENPSKFKYFRRNLELTTSPFDYIDFKSWAPFFGKITELHIFTTERLFTVDNLPNDSKLFWKSRVKRLLSLFKDIYKQREYILLSEENFLKFYRKVIDEECLWDFSFVVLLNWIRQRRLKRYDSIFDLKEENILFSKDGVALIIDYRSFEKIMRVLKAREGMISSNKSILTPEQEEEILQLYTQFLVDLSMPINVFRERIFEIKSQR